MPAPWKKSNGKPRQCIKKQRYYFAYKGPYNQSYGFSSSQVQIWELGWALKIWCLQTVVLEKTLESPLHNKESKTVNPKGNQSWISIGRADAENEAPKLWSPDVKSWIIGKDPDAGKDRKQEEKEMTEEEMIGWHHWLSGHELEQAVGDGEGQESLECCGLRDRKELDTTEWLNNKIWFTCLIKT